MISSFSRSPIASSQDLLAISEYNQKQHAANAADTKAASKSSSSTSTSELASITSRLQTSLKKFPDFPEKGILFEDFLPIFQDPHLHRDLIKALELTVKAGLPAGLTKPDVIVGLESRGFLFGPTLALRLGCSFVPVRKKGKLPGPVISASYVKEYGEDYFEMQSGAIQSGQVVVIVDDLIATGGSAMAAGELVKRLGGAVVQYVFIVELDFLNGRQKLSAPVKTLLSTQ